MQNEVLWWVAFNIFVIAMLALDLGVFHRKAHVIHIKEALEWSVAWIWKQTLTHPRRGKFSPDPILSVLAYKFSDQKGLCFQGSGAVPQVVLLILRQIQFYDSAYSLLSQDDRHAHADPFITIFAIENS